MMNNSAKIGVIVAQLGTPEAPTAKALRPYLREFLSDPRVVDLHPVKWYPILYGIVLTFRPKRSAALYKNIWTEKGSPLMVYSKAQTSGLHVASKEWNTSSHNVLNCIQKALNTYISAEVDLIPINTLNHTSDHTADQSPQYLIKPKTLMGFIWSLCLTQTNVNISL